MWYMKGVELGNLKLNFASKNYLTKHVQAFI
jgi:hypothetical protein